MDLSQLPEKLTYTVSHPSMITDKSTVTILRASPPSFASTKIFATSFSKMR